MLNNPTCLHIPPLHEGERAYLSWAVVDGAAGYILERQFNKTFEDASRGRTWSQLDSAGKTWDQLEHEGLTWEQFENLSARGRAWDSLDVEALTWDEIESKNMTWQDFETLSPSFIIYRGPGTAVPVPDRGRTWLQMDSEELTWDKFESKNLTWEQFDNLSPIGMSWGTLEAHWLNWYEFEEKKLSWDEFEQLSDGKEHRGATDNIPIGAKTAIYRIKAYDAAGIESGYLTSAILPVVPIFSRDSSVQWQASNGSDYWLFIEALRTWDMERIPLTFRYNAPILTLNDFMPQISDIQSDSNIDPYEHLRIISNVLGEIRFVCTRPTPLGETWSGCVASVNFTARRAGIAEARLF